MKKHLLLAILALTLIPVSKADEVTFTGFKGYVVIDRMINERMIQEGMNFGLGEYLGDYYSDAENNLLDLLGTYKGSDLNSTFRNGSPNAINLLLWHVALGGLAQDTALICNGTGDIRWRALPSFVEALMPICQWPALEAKSDANLLNFWLAVMSYDAPFDEYEAWREFFTSSAYSSAPADKTVSAMLLAMLMNPHFLLRK